MGQFLEIAADRPRGLNWTVTNLQKRAGVDNLDLTNLPTPYSDNQFDGIYSEHFIHSLKGVVLPINPFCLITKS